MTSNKSASDIEKYRLDVQITGDHTLQRGRDTAGLATWQKWRRGRPLGHGAFGEVHQQIWEDEHQDLQYRAVKVCLERTMQARDIDYKRELSTLAAFSNSKYSGFFVNLHGWWIESGNIFIAMEYLRYGDLSRYAKTGIPEVEIKEITENVLRGLEVMHHHGFTHRDIKPQNVLVVQKKPEFSRWWVKIADFGISKQVLEGSNTGLYSTVGTADYCAPEVQQYVAQNEDTYSNKVDMWSLGCVLFNISSRGHIPFQGLDLMRYCEGIVAFNPKNLPICLNDDGESFVKSLLQVNPERRPTATYALQHPWLTMVAGMTASDIDSISQQNFTSTPSTRPTVPSLHPGPIDLTFRPAMASSAKVPLATNGNAQQTSVRARNEYTTDPSPHTYTSQYPPIKATPITAIQRPSRVPNRLEISPSGNTPDEAISQQPKPNANASGSKLIASRITVEKWLEKTKDQFKDGKNALHFAVEQGQLEIVTYLIEQGASVNAKTDNGSTPLHYAACNGHLEIAKWLGEQSADLYAQDRTGATPFYSAVFYGKLEVAKWLKEQGVDVHVKLNADQNYLHIAAFTGHLEVVKWLKEQRVNIYAEDTTGLTPLYNAVYNGHLEVAKWLTEQGADCRMKLGSNQTLIHIAAFTGQLKVAKWLKDQGVDIHTKDTTGSTPLRNAVYNGHLEVVKWLTEQGADCLAKLGSDQTLIHVAAFTGQLEVAKWLKEQGVSIHTKDTTGSTPLRNAAYNGHLEVVKWLNSQGADIYAKINTDQTYLHIAAFTGKLEVVKWLGEQGVEIDMKSGDGSTPLHYAAHNGHLEVAKWLKEQGANIHTRNGAGQTPLEVAKSRKHPEVVNWLREYDQGSTKTSKIDRLRRWMK